MIKQEILSQEFKRQLQEVILYSQMVKSNYQAEALHQLRAALLRLGLIVRYGFSLKGKKIQRQLMMFRRSFAKCRDWDICVKRTTQHLKTVSLSKKTQQKVFMVLRKQRNKARKKAVQELSMPCYEKLIFKIRKMSLKNNRDLSEVRRYMKIVRHGIGQMKCTEESFHQIRKQIRILKYLYGVVFANNAKLNDIHWLNGLTDYLNKLGQWIDGKNTVGLLKHLEKMGVRGVDQLIMKEKKKVLRSWKQLKKISLKNEVKSLKI